MRLYIKELMSLENNILKTSKCFKHKFQDY